MGKSEVRVKGVPSVLKSLSFTGVVDGTFLLLGSFNGGRPQFFRVETSILGKNNWKERLKFNESDRQFLQENKLTFHFTITGLTPNTYEIRVLAGNDLGWIEDQHAPVTTFTVEGHFVEKSANIMPGAVGGAAAGVVIIATVVIVVMLYRRKSCTTVSYHNFSFCSHHVYLLPYYQSYNFRNIAGKMIRRQKTKDKNGIEMSSQDNPVGVYEQLQRTEQRGNRNVYDSLEVATENKTVYMDLQNDTVSSSAYATVHTATPKVDSHAVYENLKLTR